MFKLIWAQETWSKTILCKGCTRYFSTFFMLKIALCPQCQWHHLQYSDSAESNSPVSSFPLRQTPQCHWNHQFWLLGVIDSACVWSLWRTSADCSSRGGKRKGGGGAGSTRPAVETVPRWPDTFAMWHIYNIVTLWLKYTTPPILTPWCHRFR